MIQSSTAAAAEATAGLPPGATVLQVLPAMGQGGVERGTIEIARAIVEAGGRALVASAGGPNVARLHRVGAEHIDLALASKNPRRILANRAHLAALIKHRGVSLVHARSRAPAWAAVAAARRCRVPFVTTYHGAYSEKNWWKSRYNRVMASGDRVIAVSHFIADLIRQRYGTPAERIAVIHRGADLSQFRPEAIGGARLMNLLSSWGVAEHQRIILLPARLTRLKGQGLLIEAFARLAKRPELRDVVLVLPGTHDGKASYQSELERQVKRLGFRPGQVLLPGHCDDMPAAMLLADVVVSASTQPEAFGRTMAEAAAMGKPVVASAIGAAPEIVVPGSTGWLVPPAEPLALADGLEAALSLTSAEREALACKAMTRVREQFSVEAMCTSTLALYRELLVGPVHS